MFKKITNKIMVRFLRKKGYSSYFAKKLMKDIMDDLRTTKRVSLKQKIWSYRKGFFSHKIHMYNLNEENYKDYMPDFDYYRLHPINGKYRRWIDDKLTIKYILKPFSEFLPEYYFGLNRGKVTKLMDCPIQYDTNFEGILTMLRKKKSLAFKLISGSRGAGFYKVSYLNNTLYINEKETTKEEMKKFLLSLDGYVVTEYLVAHHEIRHIYDITPNALRVGVFKDNGDTNIFGAYMRFGTKKSGLIEHAHAGGIFCGVRISDGTLFKPKKYVGRKTVDILKHPDTKVSIEGKIPYWDKINDTIKQIGNYLPHLKYMGYDIIITEDGFKILEINSHQDLTNMQIYYPIKKNHGINDFFAKLNNKKS